MSKKNDKTKTESPEKPSKRRGTPTTAVGMAFNPDSEAVLLGPESGHVPAGRIPGVNLDDDTPVHRSSRHESDAREYARRVSESIAERRAEVFARLDRNPPPESKFMQEHGDFIRSLAKNDYSFPTPVVTQTFVASDDQEKVIVAFYNAAKHGQICRVFKRVEGRWKQAYLFHRELRHDQALDRIPAQFKHRLEVGVRKRKAEAGKASQ